MRRRKRHARPVEEEKLIGMAGIIEDDPDRENDQRQGNRALREAMSQLSEADQRIVYLRHYGELSFKQIADILDQPLGTVLARQHRALKKLRDLLEGKVREDGIEQVEP